MNDYGMAKVQVEYTILFYILINVYVYINIDIRIH